MPDPTTSMLSASSSSSSSRPPVQNLGVPEARPRNRRAASNNNAALANRASSTSLRTTYHDESPSRPRSPMPSARVGQQSTMSSQREGTSWFDGGGSGSGSRSTTAFQTSNLPGAWSQGWASVSGLASTWLGGTSDNNSTGGSRSGSRARKPSRRDYPGGAPTRKLPDAWGPQPPADLDPKLKDVAAGSMAEREAAFKARKTKSVLESHDGVNGGLDITGKYKRRNSDEMAGTPGTVSQEDEDCLVYVHQVETRDTYAGIVLKYRCQEQAFRKANGLWSRDSIQVRKYLTIPVDACEIKGRPCEAPSFYSSQVDHLAPTPNASSQLDAQQPPIDDFFAAANGSSSSSKGKEPSISDDEPQQPWTHLRWVKLDSHPHPVEIARISRKAMGYFPPRRKKSLHTISTLSTPRHSLDVPSIINNNNNSLGNDITSSPAGSTTSTTRHSLLTSRPPHALPGAQQPFSTSLSSHHISSSASPARSRVDSLSTNNNDDPRPAWMRRAGGVGSLSRNVRAPGPEKDILSSWARKNLPGLHDIDSLPSMSVMGSESARFGFQSTTGGHSDAGANVSDATSAAAAAGIVESSFDAGLAQGTFGVQTSGDGMQGPSLNQAAASIETWLRGAWARRSPMTPVLGPLRSSGGGGGGAGGRHAGAGNGTLGGGVAGLSSSLAVGGGGGSTGQSGGGGGHGNGDLIELEDTISEDGRHFSSSGGSLLDQHPDLETSLLNLNFNTSSGSGRRSTGGGEAVLRGRTTGGAHGRGTKGGKAD